MADDRSKLSMRGGCTRREVLRAALSASSLGLAASAASLGAGQPARPPNIIWIWADNLAYSDLGIYGGQSARTPVIDGLAREGVRFTQYYVAHVVCSPSRAALLTGRQPFRTGIVGVLRPDGPAGIPSDEITLGEALRSRGYATFAVGKWHLGDRREFLPTQHGFDRYFGIPYSMDMAPTLLYRDNEIIDNLAGSKVENITERYTDEAIRFVGENQHRPFFLYFSHTIPHPPLNLPAQARTTGRSLYEDSITHMDEQVGRLLEALDEHNLLDQSLVFFSSDNGPMVREGQTGVMRGRIGEAYEGGVRVPLIARWGGRIPTGRVVETPAIAYDIFPTVLQVAGAALPADRVYDGQNIWPLVTGSGEIKREQPFIWVYLDNVTALREGRWKLHVGNRESAFAEPELYDVEADPGETRNVARDNPDVVTRLKGKVDEFQAQVPKAWRLDYTVRDPRKLPSGVRRQ
jgi:arylsulfatase A